MKRDHLKRLPRQYYQGEAIVHWTITARDRKVGWLRSTFYYRFRELLTHTIFRYGLACPIFCLMPDHVHMIWMGLYSGCDQINAMKHFRPRCNESLEKIGFGLQDQAYDHVLTDEERIAASFQRLCDYVARNPERGGIVDSDRFAEYRFTGCIVPGYPELKPFAVGFWDRFDRIVSRLKKQGMQQWKTDDSGRGE
ncbi:hypothetical protein Poly21_10150 [Allorhodopirellula heiligendammensis]|uniref:Transposase IS200-like domain-containing protein n=2 Tax=Allorhodopirellula heiligendammensis TaxID=2714739 RepID=A0A5C6C3W3_9BACT|nr:hypothetical protein Poly21_10150 [Allorhodopirellula heiligendammensis]